MSVKKLLTTRQGQMTAGQRGSVKVLNFTRIKHLSRLSPRWLAIQEQQIESPSKIRNFPHRGMICGRHNWRAWGVVPSKTENIERSFVASLHLADESFGGVHGE
jgi:hypothetical protein